MSKTSSIDQIKQLKERDELSENRRYYKRFTEIDTLLATLNKNNIQEKRALLKYIPVAVVACIEGVFRSVVRELIDTGKPYTNRVNELERKLQIKISFEVLLQIETESITIGEIIAHTLPCNKLEDINESLSIIINKDFLSAL